MSNETEQTQSYCDGSEIQNDKVEIHQTVPLYIVRSSIDTLPLQKHLILETLANLGSIECQGFHGVDLRITSINDDFKICVVNGMLSGQREIDYISIQPIERWINDDPSKKVLSKNDDGNLSMHVSVVLKPHRALLASIPNIKEVNDWASRDKPVVKVTDELLFIGGEVENKLIGIKLALTKMLKNSEVKPFYSDDGTFKVTIDYEDIVKVQDNVNVVPFTIPVKVHAFTDDLEWQGKGTQYITGVYYNQNNQPSYTLKCFKIDERKGYDDFFKEYNSQRELLKSLK